MEINEINKNTESINKNNHNINIKINIKSFFHEHKTELIFFFVFLFFLFKFSSVLSGQVLVHETPYNFVAGDMFWLTAEGQGIMKTDDIRIRAPFLMKGDDNVFNNYPFVLPIILAELSFFTNFDTHNILLHLNIFFMIFIIITLYFILRKINKYIAIAGISLTLLMYKWPFNYVLTWGGQMTDTNMFLLFFAILLFMYLDVKHVYILLGIVNAAGIYSHARESLMFNIGILFFFIFQIITKKFNKKIFLNYIFSSIITVIVLISWIPYMKDIFGAYGGGSSLIRFCPANPASSHVVFINDLGFFKWFIIGGIILAVIILFFSKIKSYKKFGIIVFFAFMFNSYFCILGNKTTQIRHFLPITLAIFLGLFIYTIFIRIPLSKSLKNMGIILISASFLLILFFNFFPDPVPEYAVTNPMTHSAFKWIESNVKDNERILYGYGDNHYQWSLFFLPNKIHDLIQQKEFISKVQAQKMTSEFEVRKGTLGLYFQKTSWCGIKNQGIEFLENTTICDYDYFYFNEKSIHPSINQYTKQMKTILIQESKFKEVYSNELVTILKNPGVGGVCFEQRKFIPTN